MGAAAVYEVSRRLCDLSTVELPEIIEVAHERRDLCERLLIRREGFLEAIDDRGVQLVEEIAAIRRYR